MTNRKSSFLFYLYLTKTDDELSFPELFETQVNDQNCRRFVVIVPSMLVSPIPNVRESQSELVSGSPHDDIPKDESFEASRSASPDQPLLFSFDEKLNSLSTHIDQNNENEAVRFFLRVGSPRFCFI